MMFSFLAWFKKFLWLIILTVMSFYSHDDRIIILESADEVKGSLMVEDGMEQKVRIFIGDVRLRDGKVKISCDRATQFLESKKIVLDGNVHIVNDTVEIRSSNGGLYYIEEKELILDEDVFIMDGNIKAEGDELVYYGKEKKSILSGSVYVENNRGYLVCDTLLYYDQRNFSEGRHNVIVVRDSDNVVIYGDVISRDEDKQVSSIFASEGKTVALTRIDTSQSTKETDTLFIFSEYMISDDANLESAQSKVIAIGDVKIIRGDVSSIASKVIYFIEQKKIVMVGDVVFWKQDVQASADSSIIFLDKEESEFKIEKADFFNKAFILSKDSLDQKGNRYNQAAGARATVFFSEDSELDRVTVQNQTRIAYHVYDDSVARGATLVTSDTSKFIFEEGRIKEYESLGGIIGEQYPEKMVRQSPIRLEGFNDRYAERPTRQKRRRR